MFELTYNNDGKGKYQSHEVTLVDQTKFGLTSLDIGYGYGASYEEALEAFKVILSNYIKRLSDTYQVIDALTPINVDCTGRPLKE